MDFIVIGKAERHSDEPKVIYCGTSGRDAQAAVDATAGQFRHVYQVGDLPIKRYKVGKAFVAQAETPAVEVAAEVDQPKRKSKKLP